MVQLLDDAISDAENATKSVDIVPGQSVLEKLTQEKLEREVENLKLDSEYRRAQIDALKNGTDGRKSTVKLPRIDLPEFSGKTTDWPSFWDSCKATIHGNATLSKVDKFKYLLSCLRDEAKETLSGFNIGEAQCNQAIKLLEERYDDKEFIIHKYYEELSNLPKCRNSTQLLRKTFNNLETKLRSLESLGETVENKHMVAIIKNKFPTDFNLKLEESRMGEWTLQSLRITIRKLIVTREKSEESWESLGDNNVPDSEDYSSEFLLSKDMKITCIFCGLNHWHDECQKHKTLQQRKVQIRGRCFICFSTQHLFRQCGSQ